MKDAELAIVRFDNKFTFLYSTTQELTSMIVWFIGVSLVLSGTNFDLGILITFVGYVGQLSGPMNFFSHIFHWWSDSINSAQRNIAPQVVKRQVAHIYPVEINCTFLGVVHTSPPWTPKRKKRSRNLSTT